MSGVHRFLSRKDKSKSSASAAKKGLHYEHFNGVFTLDDHGKRKVDKEEDRKIKGIQARLQAHGIEKPSDANVEYALRNAVPQGDAEAAFRLLMLLEETYDGIVRPYDPSRKLLGAVNREGVTCYLDALLFAMFVRLDSFEAMLYDTFEDVERRRLAGILRLWVNLLRTGRIIPIDVTKHLQDAIAACGWADAAKLKQQDPSEAFSFITGKLELPLLTLKMDLYHTGKEDLQDDHKFINERLLEVAIPDQPTEGNAVLTLENCLEHYFNNRIEVKRHLESQRRNTLTQNGVDEKTKTGLHIEVADLGLGLDSPLTETPLSETPTSTTRSVMDKLRPTLGRGRADSIFSQRKIEMASAESPKTPNAGVDNSEQKSRKLSTRTEVLMPAWQFFKLLPWYTDHMPASDAQVVAHFSTKRPVLGICLKRYSYTNSGKAQRLDTYIDVPLEIAVPNFVSDENMEDEGPLIGNFRLLLQSVVCHRGVSVHSGHYVCLSRATSTDAPRPSLNQDQASSDSGSEAEDVWMRYDDLAKNRITYVDIHQALRDETPYLLFYQVQPIDQNGNIVHDLPSYAEATSRTRSDPMLVEKRDFEPQAEPGLTSVRTDPLEAARGRPGRFPGLTSQRTSLEMVNHSMPPRGRSSTSVCRDERRNSAAFDEHSFVGSMSTNTEATSNSVPLTPSDEKVGSFLSVIGSRRGSTKPAKSRSRPASNGPDATTGRFSLNMAKLTSKMSRVEAVSPTVDAAAPELPASGELPGSEKHPAVLSAVPVPDNESKETVAAIKDKKKEKSKSTRDRKGDKEDRECTLM